MSDVPQELQTIVEQVRNGHTATHTVRTFLSWFGAYRRSWRNVVSMRSVLEQLGIVTIPDFEGAYIDSPIRFDLKPQLESASGPQGYTVGASEPEAQHMTTITESATVTEHATVAKLADPTYRIGRLASANTPPVYVHPDAAVAEAVTIMLQNDFSQLPVMTSEREVKGLISWKSLGSRLALDCPCTAVRECMDQSFEISSDASLFIAISLIVQNECVLIRDSTKRITGIVTASDISVQFHQLAEPFLLLSEIENHVRSLIASKFDKADLQEAKDPGDQNRTINDVNDLTFGEYVRLLQNEAKWDKLGTKMDGKVFVKGLDKMREIRNDVMHFDPDGIGGDELKSLRDFAQFLNRFQRLKAT
jgi:predicted transcriptional regulator